MRCSECQHEVSENMSACPNCGNPINSTEKYSSTKGDDILFILSVIGLACTGISLILQLVLLQNSNSTIDYIRTIINNIGYYFVMVSLSISIYKKLYISNTKKAVAAFKISITSVSLQIIGFIINIIDNIIYYANLTQFQF